MTDCGSCRFAEWDYEEFSNSTERWWFVSGCVKDFEDTEGKIAMGMNDMISRHAAIENSFEVYTKEYGWCDGVSVDVINDLPPAQPEIIRCKDCKHKPSGSGVNHDISFPDEVCPCQCEDYWYSWMPKDNWFCGSWERREE